MVVLTDKTLKPKIKKTLVEMGVISQFILANTVFSKSKAIGVFSNLLKQMNAKVGLDLYRIQLPNLKDTMIVGTNYANSGGKCYFGFSSSYSSALTQHYTKVSTHDLPKREKGDSIVRLT